MRQQSSISQQRQCQRYLSAVAMSSALGRGLRRELHVPSVILTSGTRGDSHKENDLTIRFFWMCASDTFLKV